MCSPVTMQARLFHSPLFSLSSSSWVVVGEEYRSQVCWEAGICSHQRYSSASEWADCTSWLGRAGGGGGGEKYTVIYMYTCTVHVYKYTTHAHLTHIVYNNLCSTVYYTEIFVALKFSWVPSTTKIKRKFCHHEWIITTRHCISVNECSLALSSKTAFLQQQLFICRCKRVIHAHIAFFWTQ